MKKVLIIIASFFMLNITAYANSSKAYIVYDMDNNRTIMGSNINDKYLIASTSKIMTAIIAIENGNLDTKVTADEAILKAVGSSIYIEVGETLTLKDLLYGMMLRSGNDAAIMIAKAVTGSEEDFANLMNEYAKKIGMQNTYFYNCNGLENKDGNGNTSSAYDLALLVSYAFKNKTFKKIFKTKTYETKSERKHYTWLNKNKLLKYDYITGGKTGYTKKAKRTLVTTGYICDTNLVIVTLQDPDDWVDHQNIYKTIKNNYFKYQVINKNNFLIDNAIFLDDTLYIKKSYAVLVPKKDGNKIDIKYSLYNLSKYQNNQKVGYVKIFYKDNLIHQENIYVSKSKQNIFKKIKKAIFK